MRNLLVIIALSFTLTTFVQAQDQPINTIYHSFDFDSTYYAQIDSAKAWEAKLEKAKRKQEFKEFVCRSLKMFGFVFLVF